MRTHTNPHHGRIVVDTCPGADRRKLEIVRMEIGQRIAELENLFSAGKGEYGTYNYIRDDVWTRWKGEHAGLGIALDILNGKY